MALSFISFSNLFSVVLNAIKDSYIDQTSQRSAGHFAVEFKGQSNNNGNISNKKFRFYDKEESTKIGSIHLPAYLIYVGQGGNRYPHLINPKFSISNPDPNFQASMGYWPSYH